MTSPQHPNESQVDEIFRVMPNIGQAPELPILVTQEQYEAIEKLLLQERIDELETHRDANRLARATKNPNVYDMLIHDQVDVLFNKRISVLRRQLETTKEVL